MANSNEVLWSYVVESSWGVTPGSPTMKELRRTGGNLKEKINTVESKEVRSDRNLAGIFETTHDVSGNHEFELSYGSYDDLIEGLMASTWSAAVNVTAASSTIVASTRTVHVVGGFTDMVAGQWFKLSGSATAANNAYWQIETRTDADNAVVFDPLGVLTDQSSTSLTVKSGGMIRNGSTMKSFTFEQGQLDINVFRVFRGVRIGGGSLSITAADLIKGSFTLIGKDSADPSTSTIASSLTAANTNAIFNSTRNFYDLLVSQEQPSDSLTELSLEFDNKPRQNFVVGSQFASAVKFGTFRTKGSLKFYQNGKDQIEAYLAFTDGKVSFRVTDASAKSYIVTVYKFNFEDGDPDTGGLDSDVMLNCPFTAKYDSTYDCTTQIDRFS